MPSRNTLLFGIVLVSILACPTVCFAQSTPNQINPGNATGLQPYNAYGGVRENINLATGNANLQIPLLNLPGRKGQDLSLGLEYDSKIWQLHDENDPFYGLLYLWDNELRNPAVGGMGWRLNIPTLDANDNLFRYRGTNPETCTNFIVTLSDGSKHAFPNQVYCHHFTTVGGQQVLVWDAQDDINIGVSQDASYLLLDTTNRSDIVLHTKDGTRIHFPWNGMSGAYAPASSITDANGNLITFPTPGVTDTVGRTVSVNYACPGGISYKDSNGQTQTISWTCANITINPTLSPNNGTNGPGPVSMLSAVTLPNGLTYSFQYNTYGELTKISYPTGGYTRYDYGSFTNYWAMWRDPASIAATFREVTARYVCRAATGACSPTTTPEDVTSYTPTVDGTKTNNQYMVCAIL